MKRLLPELISSFELWLLIIILVSPVTHVVSQVEVPLSKRTQFTLKGDFKFVSNTILGKVSHDDGSQQFDPNKSYNEGGLNNQFQMGFIDIDNDPTTFNSSSADLIIDSKCAKIKYVGLYWTASYADTDRKENIQEIKIKYPGQNKYKNIKGGLIIHDYKDDPKSIFKQYSCYKDITSDVLNLPENRGTYTVANIPATTTKSNPDPEVGNGLAAGWTMIVIYEDISLPQKRFYVYDGYVNIDAQAEPVKFSFDNFQTIPKGAVHGKIGVISYEGDKGIRGDRFQVFSDVADKFKNLSDISNPVNNFFNANITENGKNITSRIPASYNTLGYDADLFEIKNPFNSIIGNNQNSSTFRLLTDNDGYSVLAVAFSIEIYEPAIQIVKLSEYEDNRLVFPNDVLKPEQKISYNLTVKNEGNDHAKNTIITDQLPEHVLLLEETIELPSKKIKYIINEHDHSISFMIPDKMVKLNSEAFTISYQVLVNTTCELLAKTGEIFINDQPVTAQFNGSYSDVKRFSKGYNHFNECKLPDYYPFNLAVDMTELQCPFLPNDFTASSVDLDKLTLEKGSENSSKFTESTGVNLKENDVKKGTDLHTKTNIEPTSKVTKTINELIELNEIYFEFDKWDITKRAEIELDKVVDIMKNKYPDMIIKIETHSDSRGNEYYNLLLSQRRAESIYHYLLSKNITSSRILSYIGFGETKPVNNCGDNKNCSEEEYRKNRRSNFVIM